MVFDTALSPTSTMGMQVIGLGVLQALCSQSHQCRFISADLLKLGIGTTTVVHLYLPWELWNQSSPQLCLCMCPPTKTAAAITGLTPVTGAPVIHLDVQQALSSQNCHWWHKSVDHTAAGTWLRFQPFFLSHAAPGDWLRFQLCLCMWTTHCCLHTPRVCRGGAMPTVSMLRMRLLWQGSVPPFMLALTMGLLWWTRASPVYTCGCCSDHTPAPSGCLHGANPNPLSVC